MYTKKGTLSPESIMWQKRKVFRGKAEFFPFLYMLYNRAFSSANHFLSSPCPVQCKGWAVHDLRAALCFLIICSVALGQLEQTSRLRQSKHAWKRKWLTSSELFQCPLSLLRLCVLQKCSFVFAILLEYYPSFMGRKFRSGVIWVRHVH